MIGMTVGDVLGIKTDDGKVTDDQVRTALEVLVRNRKEKALNYAVNYAEAGCWMKGEELRVQCLYVLNNMSHWRGETAKQVRETLKKFTAKK